MRGATLLRLIFVAALSLTNSSASRSTDVLPWADRAPATVMASYMQADTWHVSGSHRLHDGIDLMRNDGPIFLTPMADGWLIRCNDTGDEDERHAVLTDGSRTYVYVHIDENSVHDYLLTHLNPPCDCETLPPGGVPVTTQRAVASAFGVTNLHFAVSENQGSWRSPFAANDAFPGLVSEFHSGDTYGPGFVEAFHCPVTGLPVGSGWTIYLALADWPGAAEPFEAAVVMPRKVELIDRDFEGGYESLWNVDFSECIIDEHSDVSAYYDWTTGPDTWPSLKAEISIPGPAGVVHWIEIVMHDEVGNEGFDEACQTYTEITRLVSDLEATAEAGQIRITWSAIDFDPGVTMTVWRSDDLGITYNHMVAIVPFDGNGEYEAIDDDVLRLGYCYMIKDTEGGEGIPGPDPWWGPVGAVNNPTGVPIPAPPGGVPEIVIDMISSDEVTFQVLDGSTRTSYIEMDGTIDDTFEDCGPVLKAVGLSPGDLHSFRFRPGNAGGSGAYTDWLEMRAIDPPDAVSAFGVSNAIEVWWDPVAGADTYIVEYQLSGTAQWEEKECASPGLCLLTDLAEESIYYVGVRSVDEFGNTTARSQLVTAETEDGTVSVDPPNGGAMESWISVQNPIVESARIKFGVVSAGMVSVAVVDAGGRIVDQLVKEELSPGAHEVEWHPGEHSGYRVSSGIYFVVVRHRTGQSVRKVLLVK